MNPRAVLLDLDDTILADSVDSDRHWRDACLMHAASIGGVDPQVLCDGVSRARRWFWADLKRRRTGRLDQQAARQAIVELVLASLGVRDRGLSERIAVTHTELRDLAARPLPGALETIDWLRDRGCRIALLTNGAAAAQRAKIERSGLLPLVDLVLVEGELGFGKPDPRIYRRALRRLGVSSSEAWMASDNLEWDVAQPQRMGIFGIWVDVHRNGLPAASHVRPNAVVRELSELRSIL